MGGALGALVTIGCFARLAQMMRVREILRAARSK
jgi:hypothetical protein